MFLQWYGRKVVVFFMRTIKVSCVEKADIQINPNCLDSVRDVFVYAKQWAVKMFLRPNGVIARKMEAVTG